MGKLSKRKNKGKSKNSQAQIKDTVEASGSSVLQRLRHSDARTRHAALAALMTSILDPELLQQRKVKLELLQTIRERVMDDDLECAQLAAGCLANYASFGQQDQRLEVTASWIVVLLQRLKTCTEQLQSQPTDQWLALTMQCLSALCSLIETNTKALDRFTKGNNIPIIISCLEFGRVEFERKLTVSHATPREYSLVENMVIYAARVLHSALDDNIELLDQWKSNDPRSWQSVQDSCANESLPMLCRLHCAGCLITARLLSGDESLQAAVIMGAIPLLRSMLDFKVPFSVAESYAECYKKFMDEQADGNLEREAIKAVNQRKESARSIARRQNERKVENMKIEQRRDEEDLMDDESKQIPQVMENAREMLEEARDRWNNEIKPLELALEVLANLTSLAPKGAEIDGRGMDCDWDANADVDPIMKAQHDVTDQVVLAPLDEALIQALVVAEVPQRLTLLLEALCEPQAFTSFSEVKNDIEGLQFKCGACLGNCVSEYFPNWTEGLFGKLRLALEASNGNASIAHAMAAAMKSRSQVRKQCRASDLEFLFALALSSPCQREAVEMLGVLCSMEAHSEEVNHSVCKTLISVPLTKARVINEVFNALMDIYGDDNCHPGVFQTLDVLEYFRRTIPIFKKLARDDRNDAVEDEVEQWEETLFNAARFVAYKKGQ